MFAFLWSFLFWGRVPNLNGFFRLLEGFETLINCRITCDMWRLIFSPIGINGRPSSMTQKFCTLLKSRTESIDLVHITTESEMQKKLINQWEERSNIHHKIICN